ncbi:MAG: hypothetical protein KC609_07440 [Myxococcales bacterium]|nr:hypothetical protein [Myxococcales bacterium]
MALTFAGCAADLETNSRLGGDPQVSESTGNEPGSGKNDGLATTTGPTLDGTKLQKRPTSPTQRDGSEIPPRQGETSCPFWIEIVPLKTVPAKNNWAEGWRQIRNPLWVGSYNKPPVAGAKLFENPNYSWVNIPWSEVTIHDSQFGLTTFTKKFKMKFDLRIWYLTRVARGVEGVIDFGPGRLTANADNDLGFSKVSSHWVGWGNYYLRNSCSIELPTKKIVGDKFDVWSYDADDKLTFVTFGGPGGKEPLRIRAVVRVYY